MTKQPRQTKWSNLFSCGTMNDILLALQCQESHREFCLTVLLLLAKIQDSHTGINIQPSLLGWTLCQFENR